MTTALRIVERSEAPKTYADYLADYMAKHEATNNAWIAEVQAAQALYESGTWKETGAKNWNEFCHDNMPYKAGTYRAYRLNIPIAEIVESVTNVALDKNGARKLREKIAEVVDDGDAAIIPSIWQLCHVYDSSKIIPDKQIIEEAYEIIKEERDSNTLNVNGETINVKELAQKFRIKERVVQNIQAHSQPSKKLLIPANETALELIRSYLPNSEELPLEGADLWLSWKLPNAQS